jgi:hypothetical protein
VVKEFEVVISQARDNPKSQEFLKYFTPELVKCFKEVLAMDLKQYQAPVVNAGLMLEALGRTGQPVAGNFLAGQVKNGKHDIVKFYALKGLREYFTARPPRLSENSEDKERLEEAGRIEPIIEFVLRPSTLSANASGEEVAAFRFMRREGIKALATTRIHGIPLLKPKDEIRAPVAYALGRVLAEGKDGLSPPPVPSEKVEAAIGLCQMQVQMVPKFQPDLVLSLLSKFLMEFTQDYRTDHVQFTTKQPAVGLPNTPMLPWKYSATRLRQALKDLETILVLDKGALKKAQTLERAVDNALRVINDGKVLDEVNALRDFLQNLQVPNPAVYEGVSKYQIGQGSQ